MRSIRQLALVALMPCVALPACTTDALTEIVVVVDSDLSVPDELDAVAITVEGSSGLPHTASTTLDGPGSTPLPVTLGLHPSTAGSPSVTIRADGSLDGTRRLSAEVRTTFIEGRRLLVRIALRAECVGVVCGDGDTCSAGGVCVSAIVDPRTFPPYTGVIPSADMGAMDAGSLDLRSSAAATWS